MDVYEQAAEFRRQLQQRETAAVREMAATYQHAAERVTDRVTDLERRIADRMHAGPVPVSWLWGAGRLQDTLTDIEATVAGWANGPARAVAAAAVDLEAGIGPTVAMELVRARLNVPDSVARSLVRLRPDEVEQITGTLRPGAPLDRLFHRIAGEQADLVRDALVAGVASNQDPRVIARSIAPLVDGGLTRARTITRTELLRTSREAQRQAWLRKPGLVAGWRWWSTLDRTACPVCWAMHGTLHQLDEPFGTHPNCRCSQIPELLPASETGVPLDDLPEPRSGVDVFADLPRNVQRRILGPGKADAYQAGEITLPDLVGFRRDPMWGPTRSERALRDVQPPGR